MNTRSIMSNLKIVKFENNKGFGDENLGIQGELIMQNVMKLLNTTLYYSFYRCIQALVATITVEAKRFEWFVG
ncbi:hypothetical protein A2U01_0000505 [Trifolium medium]|uniref:Uncharacterized protein n=1 Tax=Trifolium medium TaxID=97028 RepID=A0A392LXS6_9FABA|nr:hypothetical protein [Trifolium medium]